MFLVQDLVLRAMFSFVNLAVFSTVKFHRNCLYFPFSLIQFFSHNFFSFYNALCLSNAKGRTEDVNENLQHLELDIPRNEVSAKNEGQK